MNKCIHLNLSLYMLLIYKMNIDTERDSDGYATVCVAITKITFELDSVVYIE